MLPSLCAVSLDCRVCPPCPAPLPRLVLVLWLLFGVVLSSLGQSALFGALVRPGRQRPVASVEEILATGLPVRSTLSALMFLTTLSLDKYDEVVSRASPCVLEDCVRQLLSRRDSAFCDSDAVVDLLVPREFTSSGRAAVIGALETDSFDLMHIMMTRRGFVLGRRLDTLIRRALEHGLIVKWRADLLVSQSLLRGDGVLVREAGFKRSFTLEQTLGGFMVLSIGLIVATSAFAFEISRLCPRAARPSKELRRSNPHKLTK